MMLVGVLVGGAILVMLVLMQRQMTALNESVKKVGGETGELRERVNSLSERPAPQPVYITNPYRQANPQRTPNPGLTGSAAARAGSGAGGDVQEEAEANHDSGGAEARAGSEPARPRVAEARAFVEENHINQRQWDAAVKINDGWMNSLDTVVKTHTAMPLDEMAVKRDQELQKILGSPKVVDKFHQLENAVPGIKPSVRVGDNWFSGATIQ